MAFYKVALTDSAESEFRAIAFPFRRQLNIAIFKLKAQPRPDDCIDVPENPNHFRLPRGDWEIVYSVEDATMTVRISGFLKRPFVR